MPGAPTATGCQGSGPGPDFWPEPQLDAPLSEVERRLRHVLIAMLVDADGVGVAQAEQLGDVMSVDEFVDIDLPAHRDKTTALVGSVRPTS